MCSLSSKAFLKTSSQIQTEMLIFPIFSTLTLINSSNHNPFDVVRKPSVHCGGDGICGIPATRTMRIVGGSILMEREYFNDRRNLSYQDIDEENIRIYNIHDEQELNYEDGPGKKR